MRIITPPLIVEEGDSFTNDALDRKRFGDLIGWQVGSGSLYISNASIQDINNPNNDAYWQARGWDRRPEEWRELVRGPYDGGYTGAMCKDDY